MRLAVQPDDELVPYPEQVQARYQRWLAQQEADGRSFTPEQRWWLDQIADAHRRQPGDRAGRLRLRRVLQPGRADSAALRLFGERPRRRCWTSSTRVDGMSDVDRSRQAAPDERLCQEHGYWATIGRDHWRSNENRCGRARSIRYLQTFEPTAASIRRALDCRTEDRRYEQSERDHSVRGGDVLVRRYAIWRTA